MQSFCAAMIMTSHKQPPQGAEYYCMMFGQFATQQAAGNRAQRDLKDGEDETTNKVNGDPKTKLIW
jgi:hypothetical protein